MRTLDEAIAHEKKLVDRYRVEYECECGFYGTNFVNSHNEMFDCIKHMQEHKQYAEWLTDYKRLLEFEVSMLANEDGYLATMCEQKGYNKAYEELESKYWEKLYQAERNIKNKAIDDFAKRLKARSVKVSTVKEHTYFKAVGTNEVDKIAEQLKVGGENDNL